MESHDVISKTLHYLFSFVDANHILVIIRGIDNAELDGQFATVRVKVGNGQGLMSLGALFYDFPVVVKINRRSGE